METHDLPPGLEESINVMLDSYVYYQTFFALKKASAKLEETPRSRDGDKPRKADGEKARKTKRKRILQSRRFRRLLAQVVALLLRAFYHFI
jgi:hypothetical protein